ncbi:MAG: N-acetylmuramoyl-L-alanine amidase [Deferribacterales bacterium]
MSKFTNIIVHCSDSTFGSAAVIRQWHLERGWKDIGYHFVIVNGQLVPDLKIPQMDGHIEVGRVINGDNLITGNEIGAHALGYNDKSVGICLIGVKAFSVAQMASLTTLVTHLCKTFNIIPANVLGHYETAQAHGKTCPNFDVSTLRKAVEARLAEGDKA